MRVVGGVHACVVCHAGKWIMYRSVEKERRGGKIHQGGLGCGDQVCLLAFIVRCVHHLSCFPSYMQEWEHVRSHAFNHVLVTCCFRRWRVAGGYPVLRSSECAIETWYLASQRTTHLLWPFAHCISNEDFKSTCLMQRLLMVLYWRSTGRITKT